MRWQRTGVTGESQWTIEQKYLKQVARPVIV